MARYRNTASGRNAASGKPLFKQRDSSDADDRALRVDWRRRTVDRRSGSGCIRVCLLSYQVPMQHAEVIVGDYKVVDALPVARSDR